MTTVIQVCGCIDIDGHVVPFMSNEEAEFYGVYIGEPGAFSWQADFLEYDDAITYAIAVNKVHGYPIDDKTYMEGNSNGTTH